MDMFAEKFGPYGFKRQAFMPCYGMAESVLFVSGRKELTEPPKIARLSASDLETNIIRVLEDNEFGERNVVSCGKPGSDHQIIAVDPVTITKSGPDQIGELWVKGPSVPGYYWGLEEESIATFEGYLADKGEGPFLRTGDLGFVKDGEVYVTGRLKDMIIIAGRNHYPGDIELTVQSSGAPVRMGSCAAVSETVNGAEELVIIAEVDDRKMPGNGQEEAPPDEDLVKFWHLAVKKVQGAVTQGHGLSVRSVVFVKPRSLEKTSSGKPRRRYYKDQLLKGQLAVLHEIRSPQAA
jgi:acyl-CoA synthetase (AMP-forming)/AMP-acid ligase II